MARRARPDNLHSRLVAWLKVILPLTALVILSTLFLFSRGVSLEDAIPFARVDVADRMQNPRLTGAKYATMTEDGTAITLVMDEARPDLANPESKGTAQGLAAQVQTSGGGEAILSAATADLDTTAGVLRLSGGITLETSTGYKVATEGFVLSLDRTEAHSTGPVTATGPVGSLEAGAVGLTRLPPSAEGGRAPTLLVFKGGVKLIYRPARAQGN